MQNDSARSWWRWWKFNPARQNRYRIIGQIESVIQQRYPSNKYVQLQPALNWASQASAAPRIKTLVENQRPDGALLGGGREHGCHGGSGEGDIAGDFKRDNGAGVCPVRVPTHAWPAPCVPALLCMAGASTSPCTATALLHVAASEPCTPSWPALHGCCLEPSQHLI